MSKVSMLQSGVRAFANAVKKTAIKDKKSVNLQFINEKLSFDKILSK